MLEMLHFLSKLDLERDSQWLQSIQVNQLKSRLEKMDGFWIKQIQKKLFVQMGELKKTRKNAIINDIKYEDSTKPEWLRFRRPRF